MLLLCNVLFMEYFPYSHLLDNINFDYCKSVSTFFTIIIIFFQNTAIFTKHEGIPQGSAALSKLSELYLYFYERNFIINILLYINFHDIILFSLNGNQSLSLPLAYLYNLELSTTNLTKEFYGC